MAKDTFERNKPIWSLQNSMMYSFMKEIKDVPDLTTGKVLETVHLTKGAIKSFNPTFDDFGSGVISGDDYNLTANWLYNSSDLSVNGTNKIYLIAYNPTTKHISMVTENETLSGESATFTVKKPAAGSTYFCVFASDDVNNLVSTEKALVKLSSAGVFTAL